MDEKITRRNMGGIRQRRLVRVVPPSVRLRSVGIYPNRWSDRMDLTVLLLVAMFLVYMYVNDRDDWRG